MTTGRPPFSGETSTAFISSILRSVPPTVTDLRADVPLGLEKIVDRCLAKEPHERYESARELLDALTKLHREIMGGQQAATTGRVIQDSVAVLPFTNLSPTQRANSLPTESRKRSLTRSRKLSTCMSPPVPLPSRLRGNKLICGLSANG